MEAISRESYLAYAGHKKTAELQAIYHQFDRVLSREAFELTLDALRSASDGSEEKRYAQQLLEWEIESQAAKPLAALDQREIVSAYTAVIHSPDGRVVQHHAAPIVV